MGLIAPAGPVGQSRDWIFAWEDRFPSFHYWNVDPSPVAGSGGTPSDPDLASAGGGATLRLVPGAQGATGVRLNTRGRLAIPRGAYVEFRAKLPHQTAAWPALWTMADPWPAAGEVDLVEVLQTGDDRIAEAHWHSSFHNVRTAAVLMEDADVVWHHYAAWRRKDTILWFYDGRRVGAWYGLVPNRSHWLCMDISVLAGNHIEYEDRLLVDRVRVFHPA